MSLPQPTRILWADVCRDGGSYEMGFVDSDGQDWHLRLRVRLGDSWPRVLRDRRAGYHEPVLRGPGPDATSRILDWHAAEHLRDALVSRLDDRIDLGGRGRASEMLHYLSKRGKL